MNYTWIVSLCAVFCLIIGGYLSILLGDSHIIQRFGALISGISALFIIAQVRYEIKLEKQREGLLSQEDPAVDDVFGPIRLTAERINEKRLRNALINLIKNRIHFVITISGWTFFGELIHGFGDLMISPFIAQH